MDKLKTSYLRLCKLKFKIVIKIGLQKFPKQKQYPNNTETSCSRHSSHKKKKKKQDRESPSPIRFVLVIRFLAGRFGINCPCTFLKIARTKHVVTD